MGSNIDSAPPSDKLTVCKDMGCLCGNDAILAPGKIIPLSPAPKGCNFAPAAAIT